MYVCVCILTVACSCELYKINVVHVEALSMCVVFVHFLVSKIMFTVSQTTGLATPS